MNPPASQPAMSTHILPVPRSSTLAISVSLTKSRSYGQSFSCPPVCFTWPEKWNSVNVPGELRPASQARPERMLAPVAPSLVTILMFCGSQPEAMSIERMKTTSLAPAIVSWVGLR